eukprot:gene1686-1840_t
MSDYYLNLRQDKTTFYLTMTALGVVTAVGGVMAVYLVDSDNVLWNNAQLCWWSLFYSSKQLERLERLQDLHQAMDMVKREIAGIEGLSHDPHPVDQFATMKTRLLVLSDEIDYVFKSLDNLDVEGILPSFAKQEKKNIARQLSIYGEKVDHLQRQLKEKEETIEEQNGLLEVPSTSDRL